MLLSVTLGALLYALIQFVWYSPMLFGQRWLSLKHTSPEALVGGLKSPQIVPESILQIIAPAFLMSAAIHALALVLSRLGDHIFWLGVMSMFLITILPKYRHWSRIHSDTRSLHFLGDGALATSLTLLALFVSLVQGRVY